jgi:aminoglycoside 2''-phosphotransferase
MMKQQYSISNDTIEKILNKYNLESLKSILPIKAGLINPAFLINGRYVLRIDKSDHLKNVQGHETRFNREAFLYNLLPKKGVPTPTCFGFDDSREIIPEKYIIVSYIAGTSLSVGFKALGEVTQEKLSFQMGEVIRKIHDVTPEDLNGSELFGPKTGWKKLYEKEFTFYLEEAIKGKYVSPEIEEKIKKTYQKFQNQISNLDSKLKLVHGDFSASNIQINNGNVVGVFDFEWSHIGDPLWDLQKLPINFQLGDGFNRESFLKGYGLEQITEQEQIRIKIYCFHQGMWEIWATKTQLFPFGEEEIAEGNQLINLTNFLYTQKSSDMDTYLKIVKAAFLDISDDKIQIFDDGWDYVVIVVNNEVAFRFPRREDYAKTLPVEVNFLEQFLSKSPVNIPKLKYQKDKETGISYVMYDFIPGVQFTKSVSSTFSKAELLTIAKQLSLFLTAVHSFPIEKAKQLGVQQIDSLESWQKRFTKIRKEVFPHISKSERQWVIKLFEDFLKIIKKLPIKSVLTHSDIMPEHIIVDPKTHKLSGIIDFGDILIADPAFDFTFFARYGRDFLNEAYKNYGLLRDEAFEKRRQFYEDRLVVTNLEHSLELGDKERISLHKKQIFEYVESHPLIKRPVS